MLCDYCVLTTITITDYHALLLFYKVLHHTTILPYIIDVYMLNAELIGYSIDMSRNNLKIYSSAMLFLNTTIVGNKLYTTDR